MAFINFFNIVFSLFDTFLVSLNHGDGKACIEGGDGDPRTHGAATDDTLLLNVAVHNIAIVVALLSCLAAIFSELGSERGRAAPSMMAGPMQFFAIIYVFEPLATGAMSDALAVEEGLWRTVRLAVIFGGAYYGARLIMEAYFLVWLRTFCDTFGFVPGAVQSSVAAPAPEAPETDVVLELESVA